MDLYRNNLKNRFLASSDSHRIWDPPAPHPKDDASLGTPALNFLSLAASAPQGWPKFWAPPCHILDFSSSFSILEQPGIWIYLLGGLILLFGIILLLWIRMQFNSKKFERELKGFEEQYQSKILQSQRIFIEKQEAYINEKMKELDKKERALEETLNSLEEENANRLHKIQERFEKKIDQIQKENEKENEKRIQSIQEKYEKKIHHLGAQNEKETDELKLERRKILLELEDYQKDLQQKSKNELEKIREKYEAQMHLLQDENSKLLDELHRMIELKNKARDLLPIPEKKKLFLSLKEDKNARFSEENLNVLEKQMQTTALEMEKLKEQFSTLEKKNKQELEFAQHEIDALKMKIKHGDLRG